MNAYTRKFGNGSELKIENAIVSIDGHQISSNFGRAPKNDKGIVAVADSKYGLIQADLDALHGSIKTASEAPLSEKDAELKKYCEDHDAITRTMSRGF